MYENGAIYILFDEGRIIVNGANFKYEYHLKDHLGNTRLAFRDVNGDGNIDPSNEISQVADYYPFGMRHEPFTIENAEQQYLYNGKELQEDVDWYDYGARMYDASLGRWMCVDPLAEVYINESPYVYAGNNPILFIDADGRIKKDANGNVIFVSKEPWCPFMTWGGFSSYMNRGYVYADDGTKIKAYRNDYSGMKELNTDCHGNTFAKGQVWINDNQVRKILKGDNYKKIDMTSVQVGDVIIFRVEGEIVHSVKVKSIDNKNGNITVENLAGLDIEAKEMNLEEAWDNKKAKKEAYRKQGNKAEKESDTDKETNNTSNKSDTRSEMDVSEWNNYVLERWRDEYK